MTENEGRTWFPCGLEVVCALAESVYLACERLDAGVEAVHGGWWLAEKGE